VFVEEGGFFFSFVVLLPKQQILVGEEAFC
jgi:hypothetical protein